MFEHTSKNWKKNLRYLHKIFDWVINNIGYCIIHALAIDGPNELQQCILLGASYVQRVVHALNDRFPNHPVFNATKLFCPHNYPSDDSDQITNIELWLDKILLKSQYT